MILYALVSILAWGISVIFVEEGFRESSFKTFSYKLSCLTYSLLTGLAIMSPMLLFPRTLSLPLFNIFFLCLSGFFTYFLATAIYYYCISVFGGTSVAITRIKPLIVSAIAVLLLNEIVRSFFWIGVFIVIAGSILVASVHVKPSQKSSKSSLHAFGYFYLISFSLAFFWSLGEIFAKIGLNGVDAFIGNYVSLAFGTVSLLIFIFISNRGRFIKRVKKRKFFALHGLVSFVIGYTALNYSILTIGVARTSALTAIWPLIGVILSLLVYSKSRRINPYLLMLGSFLCIIGAILV
jgi:drug/metabolite transporter (DMT)-like permease